MSHWIRASAWRFMMLMCGVLVLSGAVRANRTVNGVTVGTQSPNPVVQTKSATYAITVSFSGLTGTCTTNPLVINWTAPTGATAAFSPTTVTNAANTSILTITTTAATPAGTTNFTVTASSTSGGSCNTGTANSSPSSTLVVQAGTAPAITSAAATTFTVGAAGSFTAAATGNPAPTFSETGALPSGVTLSSAGVLSGTPGAGTGGTYAITITAANGIGSNATQAFTLTVNQAPAITSANSAAFTVNSAGTFTATATGFPAAITFSETGALPSGVTFTTAGVLSGTATVTGSFLITITASNGVSPNGTQSFTLTVGQAPAITSANVATFTVGTAGSFTVVATGFPASTFTKTGTLPSGVTLSAAGLLSGTPAAATGGTYPITITATNGIGSPANQSFTLTVNQAPAITSAASTTFTVGSAGTFTVTATGFPAPTFTETGALPGGVTLSTGGVLSGTPTATGSFPITITAANGVGSNATQAFTLTVNKVTATVAITSDTPDPSVTGQPVAVSFTVTGVGANPSPTGTVTITGSGTCSTALTPGTPSTGSCNITPTAAGAPTLTATYGGDTIYNSGTTGTAAHTVSKASTATTITTDLSAATNAGQAYTVAFAVAVTAPGAGTPTGTVTVSDGTNTCTATLPATSCSLTSLTTGAKTIVATYAGDTNFNSSPSAGTPHTVNVGNSTTTLVSGTNPSTVGGSVTFTATVAPVPTTGSVITFKDGAATIGTGNTLASGVATFATTSLSAAGSPHSITASFPGDANFNASTSNTVSQVVNKANPTNAITSDTPDPSVTGGPVTVNFSVTPVANGPNPTGTVTVTISGSAATCNGALTPANPSTGTCNISPTTVGAQTLTAIYSGDASYNAGTAATTAHTVNKASTTTTITSNLATATNVGQAYNVAFTVTATSPGTGTPTGTVTVSDGTGVNCTASVAIGNCSLTSTTAGTKTVTATYPGDTNFLTSTSPGVSHPVNAAPVITSANNTTFKVLTAGTFTVTATGTPAPTFSETGALPSGVTLAANGTLSGTPASGTVGTYPIVITATNGVAPDATQNFTLTVGQAPAITSANTTTFFANQAGSFQVTATGSPIPTFTETGTLPGTVTLSSSGLLSGTPDAGQTIPLVITITATNGVTPNATQTFTLQVYEPPLIDGAITSISLAQGSPATFTFSADGGVPPPTFSETGALPTGMTLSAAGVLSGTPTQIGTFAIVVTADNGVPPAATENFTISVGKAVASQQPFNNGHGWTWTRVSCTPGLGGSCTDGTNDTTAADCIGNTGTCLQVSAGSVGTATFAGYFHNTYTWVQLGVPSGATVLSVAGNFWDKASSGFLTTCTGGTTVGMDIFDALNATEVVAGAVNFAAADGDTTGFTHPNSTAKSVIPAAQAANTTVTLRFNFNITATFTTCKMTGDNYNLLISYIPINQHQVIVASVTIDRYGRVVGSIPLISGAQSKRSTLAAE